MRIAALIFGLLGAAGSGFIGNKWMSDPIVSGDKEKLKASYELVKNLPPNELTDPVVEAYKRSQTYVPLLGAAGLAVVGCVLVGMRMGVVAGLAFLAAFAVPLGFYQKPHVVIFTFPLAVAALLSFFVRKPTPYVPPRKRPGISEDDDIVG